MSVDDTATFHQIFTFPYKSLDLFEEHLKRFQIETASSFYKYDVLTANLYRAKTGKKLPAGFPYKSIQYRCVHCKRKGNSGRRYKSFDCQAKITISVKGSFYVLGAYTVVHSHSFQIGNANLYVANRRLDASAENDVFHLMSAISDTRELKQYILERYGKEVNRHDLKSIRCRLRCADRTPSTSSQRPPSREHKLQFANQLLDNIKAEMCNLGKDGLDEALSTLEILYKKMSDLKGTCTSNTVVIKADPDELQVLKDDSIAIPGGLRDRRTQSFLIREEDVPPPSAIIPTPNLPDSDETPILYKHDSTMLVDPADLDSVRCMICGNVDAPSEQDQVVRWVMCDNCQGWFHHTCAAYDDEDLYVCLFCT